MTIIKRYKPQDAGNGFMVRVALVRVDDESNPLLSFQGMLGSPCEFHDDLYLLQYSLRGRLGYVIWRVVFTYGPIPNTEVVCHGLKQF